MSGESADERIPRARSTWSRREPVQPQGERFPVYINQLIRQVVASFHPGSAERQDARDAEGDKQRRLLAVKTCVPCLLRGGVRSGPVC